MADFSITFRKTVAHEGGYVSAARAKQVQDSGGETYMGIARNYNPEWQGWAIIDDYKSKYGIPPHNFFFPEKYGLTAMVESQAKKKYWDAIKGDQIKNQDLANLVFELFWGSGGLGIKQMQRSINKVVSPPVTVDGVVGNDTLNALNSGNTQQIYAQIYNDRKSWYDRKLQSGNPNAKGWLNRLAAYPSELFEETKIVAKKTVEVAKQNPVLTLVAILFIIGGSAFAYYHFLYSHHNKQQQQSS